MCGNSHAPRPVKTKKLNPNLDFFLNVVRNIFTRKMGAKHTVNLFIYQI